jgi:hypothetical protein
MFANVIRFATVSVLAASIIAPAAGAGRYSLAAPSRAKVAQQQSRPVATCHQYCGALPTSGSKAPVGRSLVRTELVASSDGFDWADAAVGFGLANACGAAGLIVLSLFPSRRAHVRHVGNAS